MQTDQYLCTAGTEDEEKEYKEKHTRTMDKVHKITHVASINQRCQKKVIGYLKFDMMVGHMCTISFLEIGILDQHLGKNH